MTEPEQSLPEQVLTQAIRSGNEYGWRRNDIIPAIETARHVGLATVGGQPQFVLPDGTCELYWVNYDAADRQPGECWSEYVNRNADECIARLKQIMEKIDLIQEGIKTFEFLNQKQREGVNLEDHLCFIVYFEKNTEAEQVNQGDGE